MVTPPDKNGYVNLSLTSDYSMAVLKEGRTKGRLRVRSVKSMSRCRWIWQQFGCIYRSLTFIIEHTSPIPDFKTGGIF
jgi:hypothetical protein